MTYSKKQVAVLYFTILYVACFALYYLSIRNFEFLWYVLVLVLFGLLIGLTLRRSKFSTSLLWLLSVWGLLHMAGGGVMIGGGHVLYQWEIFHILGSGDSYILKFDQVVHFYGFGVATIVVYHLLKPYLNNKVNWKVVYPILVVAGAGLGVLNEIVEFMAVVLVSDTGVGGYFNTVLDLIFNILGACTAVLFIHAKRIQKNTATRIQATKVVESSTMA